MLSHTLGIAPNGAIVLTDDLGVWSKLPTLLPLPARELPPPACARVVLSSERLLTRTDAARYLKISPATFGRRCPVSPVGSPKRWRREDLDAWIDAGQPEAWRGPTENSVDKASQKVARPTEVTSTTEPKRDPMELRKHLKTVTAKGKQYHYFSPPGGQRTKINHEHGSSEFWSELEGLNRELQGKAYAEPPAPVDPYETAAIDPHTMTIKELVGRYKASVRFSANVDSTRKGYSRNLDYIDAEWGSRVISGIDRPKILMLREKATKSNRRHPGKVAYRKADYIIQTLQAMFSYAADHGAFNLIPNPAVRLGKAERPKGDPNAYKVNRRWKDWEVSNFLAHAPKHLAVAAGLARYAGLRKTDCITWEWARYSGAGLETIITPDEVEDEAEALSGVTSKAMVPVIIAVRPELRAVLDRATRFGPKMVASVRAKHGMTYEGFNASWQACMRDLRERNLVGPGLTHHGLRHTFCSELAEVGCTAHEIMSQSGHKSVQSVTRYVQQAQQATLSASASAKVAAAMVAKDKPRLIVDHDPAVA